MFGTFLVQVFLGLTNPQTKGHVFTFHFICQAQATTWQKETNFGSAAEYRGWLHVGRTLSTGPPRRRLATSLLETWRSSV